MKILVHEFVSGGGYAGRRVPRSLAREGSAMRTALVADLAAIGEHEIVVTADSRFPPAVPACVQIVRVGAGARRAHEEFDELIRSVEAVWLIAPETDRCLERLAAKVERKGRVLLGSGAAAIRQVSDKAGLARRLVSMGVPHPVTRVLRPGRNWHSAGARDFPVVVKPRRGAGCSGVCLARDTRELGRAVALARRTDRMESILLQRYVAGIAASVSLLTDGSRSVPLTLNLQRLRPSLPFSYLGGMTPLDHPAADLAIERALRTCEAVPGLRGWVGVDMVLTPSDAVVIEVNPRLTTAYLGVRGAVEGNVAALTLAALSGALPPRPAVRRRIHFTAAGRVVCAGGR